MEQVETAEGLGREAGSRSARERQGSRPVNDRGNSLVRGWQVVLRFLRDESSEVDRSLRRERACSRIDDAGDRESRSRGPIGLSARSLEPYES